MAITIGNFLECSEIALVKVVRLINGRHELLMYKEKKVEPMKTIILYRYAFRQNRYPGFVRLFEI